jgi:two-component system nitrate/nitrite response regulator NarL
MDRKIEVSLIGRNEIAREGLRRILISEDFTIVGSMVDPGSMELRNGSSSGDQPHIIIVDESPASEAIDQCRQLSERYPHARLVLLADDYEFDEVAHAFGNGVDGYIVKEISCEPLIESLKLVALGEKVLPSQLAQNLSGVYPKFEQSTPADNASVACLSDRETEILRCLTVGMANKVMSRRLNISEATVKVHVKAILRKLRLSNRTQAAIWAVKHGFEPQSPEHHEIPSAKDSSEAHKASILEYVG